MLAAELIKQIDNSSASTTVYITCGKEGGLGDQTMPTDWQLRRMNIEPVYFHTAHGSLVIGSSCP